MTGNRSFSRNHSHACKRCGEIFFGGRTSKICENCYKPHTRSWTPDPRIVIFKNLLRDEDALKQLRKFGRFK